MHSAGSYHLYRNTGTLTGSYVGGNLIRFFFLSSIQFKVGCVLRCFSEHHDCKQWLFVSLSVQKGENNLSVSVLYYSVMLSRSLKRCGWLALCVLKEAQASPFPPWLVKLCLVSITCRMKVSLLGFHIMYSLCIYVFTYMWLSARIYSVFPVLWLL